MGAGLASTWSNGPPQLRAPFDMLRDWTREDLRAACELWKAQAHLAVNLATFMRLLKISSRQKAQDAFDALKVKNKKKDTVDMISVFMAMALLSDQNYISKVTFLFSISDFNSSGTISHAEFCIGMRALFLGISLLFIQPVVPSLKDIEQMTDKVFGKIDTDDSGTVHLEEILTFAYRTTELRSFITTFPFKDKRVFEELIYFHATNSDYRQKEKGMIRQEETKLSMKDKLRLTPDPGVDKVRVKQIRKKGLKASKTSNDSLMSKGHAFLLWRVFCQVTDSSLLISAQDLMALLKDQGRLDDLVQQADQATSNLAEGEHQISGVGRKTMNLLQRLGDPQLLQTVSSRGEEGTKFTLRELCCVVWPTLHERDIEQCMKWCNLFHAQDVLAELLNESSEAPSVDVLDIQAIFDVIDLDGDGTISIEELCQHGGLSLEKARALVRKCDSDQTEDLSKDEVLSIVFGVNTALKSRLKGVYAASKK